MNKKFHVGGGVLGVFFYVGSLFSPLGGHAIFSVWGVFFLHGGGGGGHYIGLAPSITIFAGASCCHKNIYNLEV